MVTSHLALTERRVLLVQFKPKKICIFQFPHYVLYKKQQHSLLAFARTFGHFKEQVGIVQCQLFEVFSRVEYFLFLDDEAKTIFFEFFRRVQLSQD